MRIVSLIILSFFGAWLIKHLDDRSTFVQLFYDIPGLVFGMLLSAMILAVVYGLLRMVFSR